MKKFIYLILADVVLFSVSCSKKPLCCVLPPAIVISAERNGVAWQLPVSRSSVDNQRHILINTVGPQLLSTAKDSLAIHMTYTGIGSYALTDQQVTYTVFSNGVPTNYMLDTTFDNKMEITEYSAAYNPGATNPDPTEMKATFNLKFFDPAHTSTVSLLNGKFTVYLTN